MASKKNEIDNAEAEVNLRYSLGIMQESGDTAGMERIKKEHPKLYADWEQRNSGKAPAPTVKKSAAAAPKKSAPSAKKSTAATAPKKSAAAKSPVRKGGKK